jgi:type I restriction enzyme S subunit
MAPEGWRTTKLGNVFKSRRERAAAGLPTLSVTLNDGLVLRESLERKTDTNLSPEEHLLVRKGDLAYNMMRMWQGASGLAQFDALVSPAYVVLKPSNEIDPAFASYFFKSARMIHLFWAYSYGLTSDRLRLYFPDFSLIPVVLPPIEEQRRIAQLLETWDRAIQIVENLIENSERRKKALMRLLEGKVRLSGFGAPASDNTLPVDWKIVSLGEIGKCITGLTYSPADIVGKGSGLLVLRSSNILGSEIAFHDNVYVSAYVPATSLTRPGDILVAIRNGSRNLIGKSAVIDHSAAGMAHGAFMTLYRSDENYYLSHLFQSRMFFRKVHRNLGATINSINTSDLHRFGFPFPPKEERVAIASVLSTAARETTNLRKNLARLHLEKRALMQQLLTGKRRVNEIRAAESLTPDWTTR